MICLGKHIQKGKWTQSVYKIYSQLLIS